GVRHHGQNIHGDDRVEALIREGESAGIHLVQALHVREIPPLDPGACLVEHVEGQIDPRDAEVPFVTGQRQPGADPNLEYAASTAVDDLGHMLAADVGDATEGEVVDRCSPP